MRSVTQYSKSFSRKAFRHAGDVVRTGAGPKKGLYACTAVYFMSALGRQQSSVAVLMSGPW